MNCYSEFLIVKKKYIYIPLNIICVMGKLVIWIVVLAVVIGLFFFVTRDSSPALAPSNDLVKAPSEEVVNFPTAASNVNALQFDLMVKATGRDNGAANQELANTITKSSKS